MTNDVENGVVVAGILEVGYQYVRQKYPSICISKY